MRRLRLMCYSAIAQFLAGLWFAITLGTPLIVVLAFSVAAGFLFFRLVRGVHDLVAMVT